MNEQVLDELYKKWGRSALNLHILSLEAGRYVDDPTERKMQQYVLSSINRDRFISYLQRATFENEWLTIQDLVQLMHCNRGTIETMIKDVDKHGNLVWSIERKFDCSRTGHDFHEDNNPINFKIDIRLPSITGEGDSYEEWLVNFDYLVKRAKDYKLNIYEGGKIKGADFFETLYNKNMRKDSRIEMSEEECNLSFMYRYFIFRKEV